MKSRQVLPGPPTPRVDDPNAPAGGHPRRRKERPPPAEVHISAPPKLTNEERVERMRQGGLLTKYQYHGSSVKVKLFHVNSGGTELLWSDPNTPDKITGRMLLAETDAIVRGCRTKTFHRHTLKSGTEATCFSLVTEARTLDLQAHNEVGKNFPCQLFAQLLLCSLF